MRRLISRGFIFADANFAIFHLVKFNNFAWTFFRSVSYFMFNMKIAGKNKFLQNDRRCVDWISMICPNSQFKVLKSRIILFKSETVLKKPRQKFRLDWFWEIEEDNFRRDKHSRICQKASREIREIQSTPKLISLRHDHFVNTRF